LDFHARMYDPALGRWNVIDPMSDTRPDWSPYRYGYNNPINVTDPTGLIEVTINGDELKGKNKRKFLRSFFKTVGNSSSSGNGDCPEGNCDDDKEGEGGSSESVVQGGHMPINEVGKPISNTNFASAQAQSEEEIETTILYLTALLDSFADTNMSGANPKGGPNGEQWARIPAASLVKLPKILRTLRNMRTVQEKAAALSNFIGKNSVSLRSGKGLKRFDLVGRAHGGVPTPHVQAYKNNLVNGVVRSVSRDGKKAAEMTQRDLRMVINYLKSIK